MTTSEQPKRTFPRQETIDLIRKMEKVNATPTQFKGMSAAEIADEIVKNLGGEITIDVSKAPEAERAPIREAAGIDIEGVKPVITILGDAAEGDAEEAGYSLKLEDMILRKIDREILDDGGNKINVGRAAFRALVQALLEGPENYALVRDEWNKYIVGHETTGKADSPYDSHHISNIGLKRESEGEDSLRDEVTGFVKGIMEEFRDKVAVIFEKGEMPDHAYAEMNTLDARMLSIGLAEFSNLVRGAGYYRYRRGEAALDQYQPRRLAADIIDDLIAASND